MALSMKQLDERLSIIEDVVSDLATRVNRVEEEFAYPVKLAVGVTQDDLAELRIAVINALYNQRSQGAYNMAKGLEQKYFGGVNQQVVGDQVLTTDSLSSASKGEK